MYEHFEDEEKKKEEVKQTIDTSSTSFILGCFVWRFDKRSLAYPSVYAVNNEQFKAIT